MTADSPDSPSDDAPDRPRIPETLPVDAPRREDLPSTELQPEPPPAPLDSNQMLRRSAVQESGPPTEIGGYRVLRPLGSGAFGQVFLAEREDPRQLVAIKLLQEKYDANAEIFRRFEVEREALARLNHSGIAKLFDAGRHVDGRPYYAMEYIEGEPITEYCDRRHLDVEARIRLFQRVCDAIQHAHFRQVVHRDLKPVHMIIVEENGQPTPKIIDYGLAKTPREGVTLEWTPMGTPEYMAPEQVVEPKHFGTADSRADVYALGVVLYELIVGDRPLRFTGTLHLEAVQRTLLTEQPEPPSRRIEALDDTAYAAWAEQRSLPTNRRASSLDADLDRLALHALIKDPELRCRTAERLSSLLDAYLGGYPLDITPPSRRYLVRKFVARHKGAVGAATGALVLLIVAVVGLAFGLVASERRANSLQRTADHETLRRFEALLSLEPATLAEIDADLASDPLHPDQLSFWRDLEQSTVAIVARHESRAPERVDPTEFAEKPWSETLEAKATTEFHEHLDRIETAEANAALGLEELRRRIEWSRSVRERTVTGANAVARWAEAVATIRDPQQCPHYGGLELAPQLGLLPLRFDPDTKLYEFWLVQSGAEPTPAESGPSYWEIVDETGVVMVLLPGGSFSMGSNLASPSALLGELGEFDLLRFGPSEPFWWRDQEAWKQAVVRHGESDTTVTILRCEKTERTIETLRSPEGFVLGPTAALGDLAPESFVRFPNSLAFPARDIDRWTSSALRATGPVEVEVWRVTGEEERSLASTEGDWNVFAAAAEQPVHEVTLAPFFASKYETTTGQWLRWGGWMADGVPGAWWYPEETDKPPLSGPVRHVAFDRADRFARLLGCAIPTEAQWEYLARGGTTTPWYFGASPIGTAEHHMNFADLRARGRYNDALRTSISYGLGVSDGFKFEAPVGSYRPNPFGLHDVLGNVWEFCTGARRWSAPNLAEGVSLHRSGDGKPSRAVIAIPDNQPENYGIVRGGGFGNSIPVCRSGHRRPWDRTLPVDDTGVRLVRPVENESDAR